MPFSRPNPTRIGHLVRSYVKAGLQHDGGIFSTRQHVLSPLCYRPSVCPSVTRVDQSKQL